VPGAPAVQALHAADVLRANMDGLRETAPPLREKKVQEWGTQIFGYEDCKG
jgi:hypothetical protein